MKLKTRNGRFGNVCNAARCSQDKELVAYAPGVAFSKEEGGVTLCPAHAEKRDEERASNGAAASVPTPPPATHQEPNEALQQSLAAEAKDAKEILAMVRAYRIEGQADVNFANECLGEVKIKLKEIKAKREEATLPMNAALKAIRGWFKPAVDFYAEAEAIWKERILEGLDRLADMQRRALDAAAEAHREGDLTAVTEAMSVASQATIEAPANVSVVERWSWRITDAALIPREYLCPDEAKISGVVQAMKRDTTIPGIEAYPDNTLTRRA